MISLKYFAEDIEKEIESVKKVDLVTGKICVKRDGNSLYYYSVNETPDGKNHLERIGREEYLTLKYNNTLEKLAAKELENLQDLKKSLDVFSPEYEKLHSLLSANDSENKPAGENFTTDENWRNSADDKIQNFFLTKRGDKVRSKTEMAIADTLYSFNLRYYYEMPMFGGKIHPDFVIFDNPFSEPTIWEHFGLMDNPDYARNYVSKINFYKEHGFEVNHNLIATYECGPDANGKGTCILSSAEIEKITRKFFL